jgi:hypothetical protein
MHQVRTEPSGQAGEGIADDQLNATAAASALAAVALLA